MESPADLTFRTRSRSPRTEHSQADGKVDMEVPVIDLAPFRAADTGIGPCASLPESALKVAQQWREAFSTLGFAQIVGHGVPDEVIEKAYTVVRKFFELPFEEKKKCDLGLGYGPGGFTPQGVERVSGTASRPDGTSILGAEKARPPDYVENMLVHRRPTDVIPAGVDGYREAVYSYHDEMSRLLRTIMRLTAVCLDLPIDFFDTYFFDCSEPPRCEGSVTVRCAYYPKVPEDYVTPPGQLRYGEHTDYQGFTILWQDHNAVGPQTAKEGLSPPSGGLQVRLPNHEWIDCPPVAGAFTVNAGDLIQAWSNDVLLSNTHRVLMPPPGDRHDRLSLVFFTGPKKDTVVECLPTCCGPDRPAKYAPISAEEHLQRKLKESNK
mmetsp:Transcript_14661/g.23067  ORF Transcript_14661/g.23067 Transcript_14661/m.23067 type:complete len:379 (+) Transcript_14661:103-1239(+)